MAVDLIHPGHLSIISKAAELGEVIVGVLTDKAISTYKRVPYLSYEDRFAVISALKDVSLVVCQDSADYTENLLKYKPQYVVHGDNWKQGILSDMRAKVIDVLSGWGGELVEPASNEGFLDMCQISPLAKMPFERRGRLKRLLAVQDTVRVMEVHSGMSALIAENISVEDCGVKKEFDAVWCSSLTTSAVKGKPDTELVDLTARVDILNDVLESTSKPIIYDGDTGGEAENFWFTVKTLERLGVSAVIIEDKIGFKRNSLFGTDVEQTQSTIPDFCRKIKVGKRAQITVEFMLIARIESLILGKGLEDAVERAIEYVKAGADAIMIHSRSKDPEEVVTFCKTLKGIVPDIPIVAVPTSYNSITEQELARAGSQIVIYANHMLRAAFPAMKNVAESILKHGRSLEVDSMLLGIKDVISLIPEGDS
mmetsp:Transcript_24969/g.79092  ORF Transcript_24969/g.79092 Transcript_24969/m.79092 type:complete len:424 (-) Transcript_24969:459-1730(-)